MSTPQTPQENPAEAPAEKIAFTTEVQQLLHLMIHSLYSKREVFLRELLSNASDALDTVRFLSLTSPELKISDEEAVITLALDKDARTIVISDGGVGMTREEVVQNIGTIARSGSGALLKRIKEQGQKQSLDLIGQFGVGFYSSFMVADRVELVTLSAKPGAEAVAWSSTGGDTYALAPARRDRPGTTVTLHLKEDAAEFLEEDRIEHIVKQYSNYVKWPILLKGKRLNQATALWARRPGEISDDDYKQLYRELAGGFGDDELLGKIHLQMDAPYQFQAIVYIPKRPTLDFLFEQGGGEAGGKRRGMQLYARRVFILDHAEELLPPYLRFLRGVVDSEDLPLNVSRELLQKNQVISTIQKALVKKTLEELRRIKADKPEEYREFWDEFGAVLKEGLFLDAQSRDKLAELALFPSLKTPEDKLLSLTDYVAAMPEGQAEIYYLTAPSRALAEGSAHLEALRSRGLDVLLLTDPVDEWVVQGLTEFSGKKLKSVQKGDLELPDVPRTDAAQATEGEAAQGEAQAPPAPADEEAVGALVAALRVRFQDSLKEVRLSQRLEGSPSCLVAGAQDLGHNLEQILRRAGKKPQASKPILEVNPKNTFVQGLARLSKLRPHAEETGALCDLLLEMAYLGQGAVNRPAQLLRSLDQLAGAEASRLAQKPEGG